MLQGNRVESTLIGGPAFKIINKDDVIVKVDGNPVSEDNILSALRGDDMPESELVLTIRRAKKAASDGQVIQDEQPPLTSPDASVETEEIDIKLNRMATAEIADKRELFEHFTYMQVAKAPFFIARRRESALIRFFRAGALQRARRRRAPEEDRRHHPAVDQDHPGRHRALLQNQPSTRVHAEELQGLRRRPHQVPEAARPVHHVAGRRLPGALVRPGGAMAQRAEAGAGRRPRQARRRPEGGRGAQARQAQPLGAGRGPAGRSARHALADGPDGPALGPERRAAGGRGARGRAPPAGDGRGAAARNDREPGRPPPGHGGEKLRPRDPAAGVCSPAVASGRHCLDP